MKKWLAISLILLLAALSCIPLACDTGTSVPGDAVIDGEPATSLEGATIIDTTNNRNIGDATTPMVARVYASTGALAVPSVTDTASFLWKSAGDSSDETPITAAIAAVGAAGGGTVELSAGTFTIDAAIDLASYDNITLKGQGGQYNQDGAWADGNAQTIIYVKNGANLDAAIRTQTAGEPRVGIIIKDLSIDGNAANQASGDGDGIRIKAFHSLVENVAIRNMYGDGIHDDNGTVTGAIEIRGCEISSNGGYGINHAAHDSYIQNNNIGLNTLGQVFLNGAKSVKVSGNQIFSDAGDAFGLEILNASEITITGNGFDHAATSWIILATSGASWTQNVTITGNTFHSAGLDATNTYDGISCEVAATGYIKNTIIGMNNFVRSATDPTVYPRYYINLGNAYTDGVTIGVNLYDSRSIGTGFLNMGTATNVTISDVILPPLTSGAEVNINKWLANQSGKVVVLGKGTFNITGSIIVPSGTTLQGQGWDTKIYRTTSSYVSLAAEALDDAETGFDVDNGAEFTPGQTIRVDSEDMYISSIASNTLIVIRGHNGTTAAAHADDAAILSNGPVIVNAASMEGTSSAIAIRNLWVDAGDLDADVTQPSSTGIVLRKCDNSVVEGCWVQNCQGSHPTDTDMDVLRGNGIAVDDSDKCLIAKNYVTLTSHGGISIRTNSNYNRVVLNKVWNSQYEGIIIGNKTNVYPAANSSTGQGCSYNTIEQNMVWDNGLNTSYQKSYDIYIEDQATTGAGNPHLNNAIINNTIKYSAAFGSVADGTGTLGSSPTTLYATSANTVAVSTAGTFTVTLPTGVFAKVESGATWVVTDSPKVVTTGQTFTVEAGGSGNISITLCGLTNGITIWRGASTTATTQSTLIANNTIEGVQGNGIAVYNSHGDTITGNNVSNVRSVGYLGDGAYKQSVLGNRFVGQYGAGLSVNTCPDISVKDNIFTCPTDNGVLIYTGTSDAAVQNNKITILDSKTGILVQGATTDRPQITGNNITMTATGGSGLGIHLATSSGCDDGLIANNSITNLNASGTPNAKGIYVNSDRVTSTGNIIESTTPANGFIYAINYETTAQGGIISGNQLTNSFRAAGKAIHDENVTSPLTQVYGNVGWIAPGEIRTFTKAITAGVQDTVTSMQNTSGSNLLITEVIIKLTVAASASNPTYDCGMDDDGAGAPATNDFFEAIPDTVGVYSSVHTETYGTQTVPVSWPTSGNDWVNFIITDAAGADTVGTIYIKAMGA